MKNNNWISEIYTSRLGWEHLVDLTELSPRMAASEGERKAHQLVQEQFRASGLRNVSDHTYPMTFWQRDHTEFTLTDPDKGSLDCIALPGSPAGELSGDMIHLNYGLPEDFEHHDVEGKIVVVRSDVPDFYYHWMHRREKYELAHKHGAAAFVYANHVDGCLPPTGSLAGGKNVMGSIPAIGVSKEVGERIKMLQERHSLTASMNVSPIIDPDGSSQNSYAELGPETDDMLVVGAHVDGHDINQSAIDNGAGIAIMLEMAHSLAKREDILDTRVRFVAFGAEEFGLVGSQYYVDDHNLDRIKAVLNCDGIGRGRTSSIYTNHFPAFEEPVREISEEFNNPISTIPKYVLHSDHWPFVWSGVPGAMASSRRPQSGRGFGHTYADTLDKVDPRDIREHAILLTRLVEKLSRPSFQPEQKQPVDIQNHLKDKGFDKYLKRAGDWPYEDGNHL